MKKYINFHTLRAQILLLSLGFSTLLAFVAAYITFSVSQRYLQDSQRQSSIINLQMLGSEIDADLQRVHVFANYILMDPSMSNYLKIVSNPHSESFQKRQQALSSWKRLSDQFNSSETRSSLSRAVISSSDGKDFIQVMSSGNQNSNFSSRKILQSDFFQALYKAKGISYYGLFTNPLDSTQKQQIIPILRPIRSSNSVQVLGYMYLEMSPDMLIRRMRNFNLPEDASLYVSIGDGYSYEYKNGKLKESKIPDSALRIQLHEDSSWTLALVPSRKELLPRLHYYLGIAILIFSGIFLSGILLSLILRQLINQPVSMLLQRIEKTGHGDFSRDPSIEWNNELGSIGKGINELSENVQNLMDKRVQDEKTKKELEYQILQSQINPHFMYNSLNTIKWMATIQGADGIAEISTSLSRLLKNVAKGQQEIISLREEINLVNDYFTIMKYRYGGSIELEYEIEEDRLLDSKINRFSLQPILENAIFHGIEPKGSTGKIRIHIYRSQDKLCIEVRDNGIGMSEEQIEKTLHQSSEAQNDFFRHIGISNVNQRIHFSFGEEYGLSMESKIGEYTSVRFLLPLLPSSDAEN